MAALIVGDPVVLTNTFTAGGVNTDPTTVALTVTTPAGVSTTYTYAAGEITKSATGVYTKTVTAESAGTWAYLWSATGPGADNADGVFSVRAALSLPSTAVLTFEEARTAVNLPSATSAEKLTELVGYVTATTQALESFVGPIVRRSVTEEHAGNRSIITLRQWPVYSVTSVTEYADTVATVLAAHTIGASTTSNDYVFDARMGMIRRRTGRFAASGVVVVYQAGRFASTTTIDQRYKTAAAAMLAHIWRREEVASPQQVAAFQRSWGLPLPRPVLEFLPDQVIPTVFA